MLGVLPDGPRSAVLPMSRGGLQPGQRRSDSGPAAASTRADPVAPGWRRHQRGRDRAVTHDDDDVPRLIGGPPRRGRARPGLADDELLAPGQASLVAAGLAIGLLLLAIQL